MPISAALAGRLGPGPARRRWSPYARPHEDSGGGGEAPAPPLRLNPAATTTVLDPEQKATRAGPGRRSEVAAGSFAPGQARWRRRPGPKMVSQKAFEPGSGRWSGNAPAPVAAAPGPAQEAAPIGPGRSSEVAKTVAAAPAPANGDEKPPVEEKGDGCGGFVFQCALQGHTSAISGISLPLGSDKLYSGSADGSVRVWDCNSGKCVDIIKMEGKIGCMLTHGPWVFIGVPKSVQAWNTQTGMKLSLQGPTCLVCSMTITNDILLAGTGDGRIMAWNPRPKEISVEPAVILSGHERPVISLSVSARNLLFSSSMDKTIKVWDLMTLQCVQTLSEHKAAVTSVLCWDDKLLSCSLDKTVKVWTISKSGALQMQHNHNEEHGLRTIFGMHRVGNTPILLCSLHNNNCIRLFDLPSFGHRGTLFCKNEVRTIELAFGLLFTGDCAGELKIWRWAPHELEEASASPAESAVQHHSRTG